MGANILHKWPMKTPGLCEVGAAAARVQAWGAAREKSQWLLQALMMMAQ